MKFNKPDNSTIKRMTVQSIDSLLDTLKEQRTRLVEPFDTQIEFYEKIRAEKLKGAGNGKTSS